MPVSLQIWLATFIIVMLCGNKESDRKIGAFLYLVTVLILVMYLLIPEYL